MSSTKVTWPISKNMGVCIKNPEGTILFQNSLCQQTCYLTPETICKKFCDTLLEQIPAIAYGMTLFKEHDIESKKFDVLIIKEEAEIVTLLYPLQVSEALLKKQKKYLQELGLTKSEIPILLMVRSGLTNAKIAEKLFISRSTLKTHLNNIYKKLPPTLSTTRLRRR